MSGFIPESIQIKQPLVDDSFTHAVCIGQTGCGKTSSFILPNIKKRIDDGHGMFVIDFKGTLNQQVKALAFEKNRLKDVVEIGVAWGDSINLLSNVNKKLFLENIEKLDDEGGKDKFWTTSALSILGVIYDILKYIGYMQSLEPNKTYLRDFQNKYSLNIKTFATITQNKDFLESFIKSVRNKSNSLLKRFENTKIYSKNREAQIPIPKISPPNRDEKLTRKFLLNIEYFLGKLKIFAEGIDEDKPSSGSGGVLFMIKSFLNSYDQNGLNGDKDVLDMLESNKIVIIRADSFTKYATESLMHILYTRLAKRDSKNPITLVIDEFQRTITKNSIPFVDVFREKKVELIAAFQNESQLNIKLGEEQAQEFLLNMVSRFDYAQIDGVELKTFEYTTKNKKYTAKPIFFKEQDLQDIQFILQEKTKNTIQKKGKWIYQKSYDVEKCQIMNLRTKKSEVYYVLSEEEENMVGL